MLRNMFSTAKFLLNSKKPIRIFSFSFSTPQTFGLKSEPTLVSSEKIKRDPFMKNVFLGIVDDIFLQFPDPKYYERSKEFQKLIDDVKKSFGNNDLSTYDKFKKLVKCGILRCQFPESYGGTVMSCNEFLYLYEELNLNPSLSVLLETQSSLVLRTILDYGNDDIKKKYVPQLLSGEISGAYALSEECSGSDPTNLKTVAEELENCFNLYGEKIWVTNGECADFFLVFANIATKHNNLGKQLSVFLVERSQELTLEKHSLLGLNECGLCKVKLKNVLVPKSHLIGKIGEGYQLAGNSLRYHKYIVLISVLNHLKYFLSSAVDFVNGKKQFPVDLKDCELIKNKLAQITRTIYSFESMLYFTSGMLDKYIIDDALESAILQVYGFEKGLESISQCMNILGSRAYDVSYPYEELWRDLKGLSLSIKTNDIMKLYISLIGIDHAGNKMKNIIMKNRNPFHFPSFAFKKVVSNSQHIKDKPKLHLKLYMNFHPNLKPAADQLEYSILRLQYVIETILTRHGSDLIKRQLELIRVADIACDIYSMIAVLSRASKAYCTGVQFSDQEIALASACCYYSLVRIKKNVNDILNLENKHSDVRSLDISSHILNNSYFFVHPLQPNIV